MQINTTIKYDYVDYKVSLTETCTSIQNSNIMGKRNDMNNFLNILKKDYSDKNLAINKRTNKSMIREWCAHNLLCNKGILENRTCCVDLNINQKWYVKLGYFILNIFYV